MARKRGDRHHTTEPSKLHSQGQTNKPQCSSEPTVRSVDRHCCQPYLIFCLESLSHSNKEAKLSQGNNIPNFCSLSIKAKKQLQLKQLENVIQELFGFLKKWNIQWLTHIARNTEPILTSLLHRHFAELGAE